MSSIEILLCEILKEIYNAFFFLCKKKKNCDMVYVIIISSNQFLLTFLLSEVGYCYYKEAIIM